MDSLELEARLVLDTRRGQVLGKVAGLDPIQLQLVKAEPNHPAGRLRCIAHAPVRQTDPIADLRAMMLRNHAQTDTPHKHLLHPVDNCERITYAPRRRFVRMPDKSLRRALRV